MKVLIITIVAIFLVIPFSFAQVNTQTPSATGDMVASENEMLFGASKQVQAQETYQIGFAEEGADYQIFIPKSFSPNEDGVNDIFNIQSRNLLDLELMIFDQWGNFKYASKEINAKWDGSIDGEQLTSGVYVYVVKIKTLNGIFKSYSGTILIEE